MDSTCRALHFDGNECRRDYSLIYLLSPPLPITVIEVDSTKMSHTGFPTHLAYGDTLYYLGNVRR